MNPSDVAALIQYRLEQARTALDDGKFLLEGGRSPQSIINRAYYSMFYAAIALLQKVGKTPSKHSGAISLFDTEFVAKGAFPKELSRDLHKAFEQRQASDYRTTEIPTTEKARETLEKAAAFVEAVTAYLSRPRAT